MAAVPFTPVIDEAAPSAEVRVGLDLNPPLQSRLSVFFRFFLLLPLALMTYGIFFGGFFVVIASWFCGIASKRVPDRLQTYLTRALRFLVNLEAYGTLLVAQWPELPWKGSDEDQATLEIDHVELNRAAVLFRLILAVPAYLLLSFLMWGRLLMVIAMWFCALFTRRAPRTLHQAVAAIVRFEIRFWAYVGLASPTQPFSGLLGDQPDETTPAESTWEAPDESARLSGTSVPASSPVGPSTRPLSTRWALVSSARGFVIASLIVGGVIQVAYWSTIPFSGQVSVSTNPLTGAEATMSPQDRATLAAVQASSNSMQASDAKYGTAANSCGADVSTFLTCNAAALTTYAAETQQAITTLVADGHPSARVLTEFQAYVDSLRSVEQAQRAVADASSVPDQLSVFKARFAPAEAAMFQKLDDLTTSLLRSTS